MEGKHDERKTYSEEERMKKKTYVSSCNAIKIARAVATNRNREICSANSFCKDVILLK